MDQAAIDIRYGELLIWLEGRYLIPKDWPKRLELIGVKKQELMEELWKKESPEMKKIQDTFKSFRNNVENFNYNDIMRLNTLLLKTEEAKDKTLFGNFNSKLIKDCVLLVGIYNKNNIHLCESSKIIIQNIGYEIPINEKSIQSNERTISDYQSKIEDKMGVIERNQEKIKNIFRKYEVKETEIVNEFAMSLIDRLNFLETNYLTNLETNLKSLKITEAIRVYKDFYCKIYNQDIETVDKNFLINLIKVNKLGDFLIKLNKPEFVDETPERNKYSRILLKKLNEYREKYESVNIQADIEAQMWNFKLVSQDDANGDNNNEDFHSTALLDLKTRKAIINDISELLIFIKHRLAQVNNKDEVNLNIYQENLRELSLKITPNFLKETKEFLENLLNLFNNKDFQFLLSIFDDEKNLKGILNSFELLKSENAKTKKTIDELNAKIEEIKKESLDYEKKIVQIKKDSKLVKKQIEKNLIDLLKRKVTIIGDINLI